MSDHTCGSCRYFKREELPYDGGYCHWAEINVLPPWMQNAAGLGYDAVLGTEGDDCHCWQSGGEE